MAPTPWRSDSATCQHKAFAYHNPKGLTHVCH